ncbi:MAG: NAD(+)/NADH kinase [Akkermansia sp.]
MSAMFTPHLIGLVALTDKLGVDEALRTVSSAIEKAGMESVLIRELAQLEQFVTEGDQAAILSKVELLLTFGGDGTMLSMAATSAMSQVPLAGVNLGRLGFLTTCSVQGIEYFVECLRQGTCLVRERSLLEAQSVSADGTRREGRKLALNEVTLMRSQNGKMVDLDAVVNGVLLNRYHADGVLVATPTGSSAYSLSAGGPLVWPESDVICVTPVCPHSLTNRSVILPDSVEIQLRPRARRGRSDSMLYSLDGRDTHTIEVGESLIVKKAPEQLQLVHLPDYNFAELLRAKLRWQGTELPWDDE